MKPTLSISFAKELIPFSTLSESFLRLSSWRWAWSTKTEFQFGLNFVGRELINSVFRGNGVWEKCSRSKQIPEHIICHCMDCILSNVALLSHQIICEKKLFSSETQNCRTVHSLLQVLLVKFHARSYSASQRKIFPFNERLTLKDDFLLGDHQCFRLREIYSPGDFMHPLQFVYCYIARYCVKNSTCAGGVKFINPLSCEEGRGGDRIDPRYNSKLNNLKRCFHHLLIILPRL